MTSLPPNADELVSAYLDGEAAPDEIELVEASAELMARVESLRSLAEALGAPLSPPAAQRELHISAALDAFDEVFGASGEQPAATEPAGPPPVTSLAAARERRRPRRYTGLIAAAAAAVLLFVGITALSVGRDNDDSFDVAESASDAVEASDAVDDGDTSDNATDESVTESADLQAADEGAAERTGAAAFSEAPSEPQAESEAEPPPAIAADRAPEEVEEAMDDDEAMDEEEAMEEEDGTTFDDSGDADSAADSSDAIGGVAAPGFDLGAFESSESLNDRVSSFGVDDLEARKLTNGEGLFSSCQEEVPELAEGPNSTWIATAVVEGRFVEIHLVPDDQVPAPTLLIVDPNGCVITDEVLAGQ